MARKAHAVFVEKLECSFDCTLRFSPRHRTLCVPPFGQRAFVPIRRWFSSIRNEIIAVIAHGDF
jgi:hypothetical protein